MSTTFSVFIDASRMPTYGELFERTENLFSNFLQKRGFTSHYTLEVEIWENWKDNESQRTPDPEERVVLPKKGFLWFYLNGAKGGTNVFLSTFDDEEEKIEFLNEWQDTVREHHPFREEMVVERIRKADTVLHFRRSMGQPTLIALFYGILAAAFAQLTDGALYSDDGGWDYNRFPCLPEEFMDFYFDPDDEKNSASFRDWAHRCLDGNLDD